MDAGAVHPSFIAILQRIIARLELGQLSLRRENKTMHHIGGQVASILWPRKNVKRNPTTEETNELGQDDQSSPPKL